MKDLTEIEVFEIIARRVNKLFNEANDEIEISLAKLNSVESIDDMEETDLLNAENFTNGVVMCCNIHEMFWSGLLHLYPDTFNVLNKKAKQGKIK